MTEPDQEPIDDELPLEADEADVVEQRLVAPVADDDESGR
jgi:hypothetical protein